MKAKDLKEGDSFKLPGKRKYRQISVIRHLGHEETIPGEHRGKLLIVMSDCRQMILNPERDIIFPPVTPLQKKVASEKNVFEMPGAGSPKKEEY